ncbi:MAG: AbrB/MazE/SpoVT family DNA-binding domain-containing protein [Bacilli bacterium]
MEIRIQKWGNSDGIRIPSSILKSLNIKTNDILNIEQKDDQIIISIPKKKKISLSDRFKEYKGKNLAKNYSWDDPKGREIW